jgi:hypothetical protein
MARDLRLELCWSAAKGLMNYDPLSAAYYGAQYAIQAHRAADIRHICSARALQVMLLSLLGQRTHKRCQKILAFLEKLAVEIPPASANAHARGLIAMAEGFRHYFLGRTHAALDHLNNAAEILKNGCAGVSWELDILTFYRQWCLHMGGQIRELTALVPHVLREAEERNDLFLKICIASPAGVISWLAADKVDEARNVSQSIIGQWPKAGFYIQHLFALMAETQIDLYSGDGMQAWENINQKWRAYHASEFDRVQVVRVYMWYLRACCALAASGQDPSRSRSLLRCAERDAYRMARERCDWSEYWADALFGAILSLRGDVPAAVKSLRRAADGLTRNGTHLIALSTRRQLGELLGGDEGRKLTQEIDDSLRSQGIQNPSRMAQSILPAFPAAAPGRH